MSEGVDTAHPLAQAPTWKTSRAQGVHRFNLFLPEGLRERLDGQWNALRSRPRLEQPWPLSGIRSRSELVALGCDQLCDQIEATYGAPLPQELPTGPIQLGSLSLDPNPSAPVYLRPWEEGGEERVRIMVQMPTQVWRRLSTVTDWLRPRLVRSGPRRTVISNVPDLVALACHQLCTQLPPPSETSTGDETQSLPLYAWIPAKDREELSELSTQLQAGSQLWIDGEPTGARSLSDLVAVAVQRMLAATQNSPQPDFSPT